LILGAGMTGLAAGLVSGLPVYEAEETPGGICNSYYVSPHGKVRLSASPPDGEAYRFEKGGGHWIFGGDPLVLRSIGQMVELKSYVRKATIYFSKRGLHVPYPVQNHLRYLGPEVASKILREMLSSRAGAMPVGTLADWLLTSFGPTLGEIFFEPFHELYTAGLWRRVVPQDSYKSPVDLSLAVQGALDEAPAAGYNVTFSYPIVGLDMLGRRMAERCATHYGRKAVRIDVKEKVVEFEDGSCVPYESLVSTLPLNRMMALCELNVDEAPDPSVSVLVVNVGAKRGSRCPDDHWVYVPGSRAGFHRIGFYSNVDPSFLPRSQQAAGERVSVYVEKAYRDGGRPTAKETAAVCEEVVRELQEWEWLGEVEAIDPTWIEVAYTWSWQGSRWKGKALRALAEHDILQVGRFARWNFQGIADSVRDGFIAGAAVAAGRKDAPVAR
jgi:protoporphyrinogen oxidase